MQYNLKFDLKNKLTCFQLSPQILPNTSPLLIKTFQEQINVYENIEITEKQPL